MLRSTLCECFLFNILVWLDDKSNIVNTCKFCCTFMCHFCTFCSVCVLELMYVLFLYVFVCFGLRNLCCSDVMWCLCHSVETLLAIHIDAVSALVVVLIDYSH